MLRRPGERDALLGALRGYDRLVLLGDIVELRQGPVRDALAAAEPVLSAIGEALGPDGEVVLVPGNHDHHLAATALERRARASVAPPALGLETELDWAPDEPLGRIAAFLEPASVRASYPGAWLREDVYATHGHYCDRHTTVPMFERLGAGLMARVVHEPDDGPSSSEDYEAILAPIYAWIHAVAQNRGSVPGRSSHGASAQAWQLLSRRGTRRMLRHRALVAGFPLIVAALNRARLGPLRADVSGEELRRAGLRAFGEVLERLGVHARWVIFGHTHRAGPLEADDRTGWTTHTGTRLINSGSWVLEPEFLGTEPAKSPYRPGFSVVLEDGREPELINQLDVTGPGQV